MIDTAPSAKDLRRIVAAGFALRLLVSVLTPVPREDGANYLWMAERFASGEAGLALSEVFSPPGHTTTTSATSVAVPRPKCARGSSDDR